MLHFYNNVMVSNLVSSIFLVLLRLYQYWLTTSDLTPVLIYISTNKYHFATQKFSYNHSHEHKHSIDSSFLISLLYWLTSSLSACETTMLVFPPLINMACLSFSISLGSLFSRNRFPCCVLGLLWIWKS